MDYMKKVLILFLFMCAVGWNSCGNHLEDLSNVEFSKLSTKEAQECMLGTWRVLQQCGGIVGCINYTEYLEEYTPEQLVYTISDSAISGTYKIREWKKEQRGYRLLLEDRESYILLHSIKNDTLYKSDGKEDESGFTWIAVRVK